MDDLADLWADVSSRVEDVRGLYDALDLNGRYTRLFGSGPVRRRDPLAASFSSSGYGCDTGISIALVIIAVLGIALMFNTLLTKITGGRRRKKRDIGRILLSDVDLHSLLVGGS